MHKYLRMDLGKAMSTSGMLVALSSVFFYDKTSVVVSVLATYFGGLLVDHFIFGLNIKRRVCILSNRHDEILNFILQYIYTHNLSMKKTVCAYQENSRNC